MKMYVKTYTSVESVEGHLKAERMIDYINNNHLNIRLLNDNNLGLGQSWSI
jgi:hypothetical protein